MRSYVQYSLSVDTNGLRTAKVKSRKKKKKKKKSTGIVCLVLESYYQAAMLDSNQRQCIYHCYVNHVVTENDITQTTRKCI